MDEKAVQERPSTMAGGYLDLAESMIRVERERIERDLGRRARVDNQEGAGSFGKTSEAMESRSGEVTLANVEYLMAYHSWDGHQREAGDQVREALTFAAKAILRNVPAGRSRSVTLRNILEARMNANAGISFGGGF